MKVQNDATNALAHPGKRFQGQFIDGLIAYIIGIALYFPLSVTTNSGLAVVLGMIAGLLYFLLSDALPNGQSIGKRILKIQVVHSKTAMPCSIGQSFLRNITFPLGIIDWLFIFFGSHRRLGDFIANTIVVKLNEKPT
jgi:uncharacterized RDD family membrane protein YckC